MKRVLIGGAVLAAMVGCGGHTTEEDAEGGHTTAPAPPPSALPACTWPASLDRPDSGNAGGWVDRTLLVCGKPSGETSVCPSDGGKEECAGSLHPCVMACGEHQYLVTTEVQMPVFGSPDGGGPYSPMLLVPTLPSGCTSPSLSVANPEFTYQCCPCQ